MPRAKGRAGKRCAETRLYPSKAAWNRDVKATANVRNYGRWFLPAGVSVAHELADTVVEQLGPNFNARHLLCLHHTRVVPGTSLENMVKVAVWSAKQPGVRRPGGELCCNCLRHDIDPGDFDQQVEDLCGHCLKQCTCWDTREDSGEHCGCGINITPQQAVLRGFGGPGSRVKITPAPRRESAS